MKGVISRLHRSAQATRRGFGPPLARTPRPVYLLAATPEITTPQ